MSEASVAPNATYQSAERVLALLKSFDDTRATLHALGLLCASA